MQNNNEPTNKLEELESACEETKISSIAKKKQKLAQDEDLLENEIIEELVEEDTTEGATYKEIGPKRLVLRRFFRSKLSIVGIVMIVSLFLFSFLGPVIYQKWGESTVDRSSTVKVLETPHTWTDEEGNKIQVIEEVTIITEINSYADPSK